MTTMVGENGPKAVLIVIVNYRTAGLSIDCLRSLGAEIAANPGARAVVVENASGDDSADRLAAAIRDNGWAGWASLEIAPRNAGFAAGNNVAIAPAMASPRPPDYVWLLNPDTIVRPGALGELVGFLEHRPDVGIAGSRLEHPDASPQGSAYRFPTALDELNKGLRIGAVKRLLDRLSPAPVSDYEWPRVPDQVCQVDWAAGASLLIRRAVFDAIGLLDEGYFMYYEEVDFCLKAGRAGWSCWYVPASRVVHLVGQSSGVTRAGEERKRLPRYWFEARRRFFLSNHGRAKTLAANMLYTIGYSTHRLRRLIRRKPDQDPQWMLWDFIRYNFLPVKQR